MIPSSYQDLNQEQSRSLSVGFNHKRCRRCKQVKAFSEFYVRSGVTEPTIAGHYNSECKACLRERSKSHAYIPKTLAYRQTEQVAISRLNAEGIAALPGKAVHASDVDVVAWGHVWIEIKHSPLRDNHGHPCFYFTSTLKQMKRGYLAKIVMLICDYSNEERTFHLLRSTDPVFYVGNRVKSAVVYTVNRRNKPFNLPGRVSMTKDMMDAAENQWHLIEQVRREISADLIGS